MVKKCTIGTKCNQTCINSGFDCKSSLSTKVSSTVNSVSNKIVTKLEYEDYRLNKTSAYIKGVSQEVYSLRSDSEFPDFSSLELPPGSIVEFRPNGGPGTDSEEYARERGFGHIAKNSESQFAKIAEDGSLTPVDSGIADIEKYRSGWINSQMWKGEKDLPTLLEEAKSKDFSISTNIEENDSNKSEDKSPSEIIKISEFKGNISSSTSKNPYEEIGQGSSFEGIRRRFGLSEDEDPYEIVQHLTTYTGSKYAEVRKADKEENYSSKYGESAKIINNFLKASPRYSGEVYRGLDFKGDIKRKVEFLSSFREGEELELEAISSFSSSPSVARDFATSSGYSTGVTLTVKNNKSGVSIREFSAYKPEEDEIAVPKGARYRILKVSNPENEVATIELEEI